MAQAVVVHGKLQHIQEAAVRRRYILKSRQSISLFLLRHSVVIGRKIRTKSKGPIPSII